MTLQSHTALDNNVPVGGGVVERYQGGNIAVPGVGGFDLL